MTVVAVLAVIVVVVALIGLCLLAALVGVLTRILSELTACRMTAIHGARAITSLQGPLSDVALTLTRPQRIDAYHHWPSASDAVWDAAAGGKPS